MKIEKRASGEVSFFIVGFFDVYEVRSNINPVFINFSLSLLFLIIIFLPYFTSIIFSVNETFPTVIL
jgi:hypothetical protein